MFNGVKIPNSVTNIGISAFSNNSAFERIWIPASVTVIGSNAFANCPSLSIFAQAPNRPPGWSWNWDPNHRPIIWGSPVPYDIPSGGGSGRDYDPFIISTAYHLKNIWWGDSDTHYLLADNIDLGHTVWVSNLEFRGHLDGAGNTITIQEPNGGLFAINRGTIYDLTVRARIAHMMGGTLGSIASINHGSIIKCISDPLPGAYPLHLYTGTLGGIAGENHGRIENSTNNVNITVWNYSAASGTESHNYTIISVGGIAGVNYGTIVDCTNNGDIYTAGIAWYYMGEEYYGGIAGIHAGGNITNNVNNGSVIDNWGTAYT
jgi:hypothetical protein